jgi:hypothetical protein
MDLPAYSAPSGSFYVGVDWATAYCLSCLFIKVAEVHSEHFYSENGQKRKPEAKLKCQIKGLDCCLIIKEEHRQAKEKAFSLWSQLEALASLNGGREKESKDVDMSASAPQTPPTEEARPPFVSN